MMRLLRDRFIKKSREGSSLVSVVIGVLFLAAIGLIVLTAANQYMISVNVDHNSSNNFYDAEAVLEEVKTGLLEYAGDASEEAYRYVLENYGEYKNSKRELFSKEYLSRMMERLQTSTSGSAVTFEWKDEKLGKPQAGDIQKLKVLSKVPESVTLTKGENLSLILQKDKETKEYSLVISNLMINHTNEVGYRTSIQTDVRLSVPDYSLEGNSTFDAMKDFVSISDDTLHVGSTASGCGVLGSVYTGNEQEGIQIDKDGKVDFKSPIIISRGDLVINPNTRVSLSGETGIGDLYLKNIRLKTHDTASTESTELTLHENAYIANDLNIESNNATVSLGGKYYGYSFNEKNEVGSSDTTISDYSSAILINGKNTTLKTDGIDPESKDDDLKTLVLAGRAFVAREKDPDGTKPVSDIMMGESISVKSNQLAYLVPDKYIYAKSGNSDDYQNPVFKSDIDKIDEERMKDELLKGELKDYLNKSKPYEANYNHTVGYVFFYLKFEDEDAANKYFEYYYEGTEVDEDGETISHEDNLVDKGKVYISNKGTDTKFDPSLYLLAGNMIDIDSYNASGELRKATYHEQFLTEGQQMGQNYVGYQLGLSPAKTNGNMRLSGGDASLVADTIVNFSKMSKSTIKKVSNDTKVEGATLYIHKGDYSVGSEFTGLLIVDGNVTVNSNFTGLILATGKVTVNSAVQMKSDMVTVGKLFDYIRTDKELVDLFRELNGTLKTYPANLTECVSYQNWSKNSY